MTAAAPPHRTYLYAPGHVARIVDKALASTADAVILDLEDAVPQSEKRAARDAVHELACGFGRRFHVRVNRGVDADVRAAVGPATEAIRLPKVETTDEVRNAEALIAEREATLGLPIGAIGLYLTIESALGAHRAADLLGASDRTVRLAFGATDFLADIGAVGAAPDGEATVVARGMLVIASRVASRAAPIDSVHTRLDDDEGLRRSATWARSLGFFGKSVIHPRQVPIVHEAFTPTEAEVAWATNVEEALAEAEIVGSSAVVLAGEFVDPAVVARAQGILRLARR